MSADRCEPAPLEDRVRRLEEWAAQPSWLDGPAEIGGEPIVMGDSYPMVMWAWLAVFASAGLFVVVALIYHAITGHPL